jgi:predicted nucleic acid-binding protein
MILLDTDIIIDNLRGYQPAREWFASVQDEEISLPGFVAMELLQGCQNTQEQKRIEKVLATYTLYWAEPQDCARAIKNFAAYHLSHQLGLLDALIAETAVGVGAQLATFNTKHYSVLKELKTIQPYQR